MCHPGIFCVQGYHQPQKMSGLPASHCIDKNQNIFRLQGRPIYEHKPKLAMAGGDPEY